MAKPDAQSEFDAQLAYWQAIGIACRRCGDLELIEPDEGVANGPFTDKGICTNCVEDGW